MTYLINASKSEKEVEKLLKDLLPGTEFSGKVKAVGGYVRDEYLSILKDDPEIDPKDLDIVVGMRGGAKKLTHYLHKQLGDSVSSPHQMGAEYPIWQLSFKSDITYNGKEYGTKGAVIEFVDPMKESYPDPSSRQRKVEPATIKEDIARRDFTVNMLLKDLTTGEIEDLTGQSKEDIKRGVLKGHPEINPDTMFSQDPLRMLRLIRFHIKYDWSIPKFMLKAVKRNAERIEIVSAERIMGELKKVMEMGKLQKAVRLMSMTGLLKYIFPEVEALKGEGQSKTYHQEGDVYKHTLMVLKNAPPGIENQMAALLHDIGKPVVAEKLGDNIKHHGHEKVGAEIAEAILKRLKFENAAIKKIKSMVQNHMRPHMLSESRTKGVTIKALRKFIRNVGDEMVDAILDLAHADELGRIPSTENIPELREKIKEVKKGPAPSKKTILNGKEIMDLLGLKQGPEVGRAQDMVRDIEDDYAEKGEELTKEKAKSELKKNFRKAGRIPLASVIRSVMEELPV